MNSVERKEARYWRRRRRREAKRIDAVLDTGTMDAALSLCNLVRASRSCQRGVSWKRSVQGFCLNRVLQCARIHREWIEGRYDPGRAKRFTISERGKTRSISAVPFRDRVVQRSLCDTVLVPLVRRSLIFDNGASLKGKGTTFALDRLELHLLQLLRITDPFVFLKTRFQMDEHGQIHRRVCSDSIKREKRKLRKFKAMVAAGRLRLADVARSYASWRGVLDRGDAGRFLKYKMDCYFYGVFGVG